MSDLIRYDAMCSAIAECHSVDEVADLKNKARALELYAKQAKNTDAERRACEIRLRAERRTGELLRDLARATPAEAAAVGGQTGGRGRDSHVAPLDKAIQPASPYAETLTRTGISRQTAHRYQALAAVPQATFDEALREPTKPTTSGVLAKAEATRVVQQARDPAPQMPADSLWLWGRMRDLEREGYFSKDAARLLAPMTETMLADMQRILPLCLEFITTLNEATHESA